MNRKKGRVASVKRARANPDPANGAALRLELGINHHRAGRLLQAEQSYQAALRLSPGEQSVQEHSDALHLLGVVRMQSGRLDEAVELISRAVSRHPSNPTYLSNLGIANLERGLTDEAIGQLREALRHDPDHADARYNLGNALKLVGAVDEALEQYLIIAERQPGNALARNNAAICLLQKEEWEPAIVHLMAAVKAEPAYSDGHANLAMALFSLGRLHEAEHHARQALAQAPDQTAALVCLGNIQRGRNEYEPALECYRRATVADPAYDAAYNNLGNALAELGRYDEALTALQRAAELAADPADALGNSGRVLKALGRLDDAIEVYDAALDHNSDHLNARFGRAQVHLLQGRFAEGWADYLARDSMAGRADAFDRDRLAVDLTGAVCRIEQDQGLGDEIFFLRFVPMLKARGASVVYRPDPRLAAMLVRAKIVDDIIEGETPGGGWDHRIAVGDLPHVLGAGDQHPPPSIRLEPIPKLARETAECLATFGPPPYIGLSWWAGTRGIDRALYKNAPLDLFAEALRDTPGTIVALQRAPEEHDLGRLDAALGRPVLNLTALNANLEAILALVGLLDDYVAVSNTNVHLRSAVGRKSRVLIPTPPEFRWMKDGSESTWFPGTTVYRQDASGDWTRAFDRLRTDLIKCHGAI